MSSRERSDIWNQGEGKKKRGREGNGESGNNVGPQDSSVRKSQAADAECQARGASSESPVGTEAAPSRTCPAVLMGQRCLGTAQAYTSTLLKLIRGGLRGCVLPSFLAPEAPKRHTKAI